jgi:IclR family transcriptional regulator, acetate operon repressor
VVGAARTVGIREAFASAPSGMTKGELSIALRARKSVISRLLSTLAAHRYASPHPTGRFRLGLPVLAAALRYADRLGFPGICMPVLQRMADETGELVQLAVVQDGRLLSVAKAEGHDQRIRIVSVIGQTRPLHATASGKAYLASRPEDAALMLARRQGLTPLTRKTLTSLDNLRKELLRVRRQGYAIVEEEFVEGGGAVAAAISVLCFKGRVVGAIGISGPEFRFSLPRKREVAPMVLAAAARVVEIWPLDLEDRPVSVAFPEGVR